MTRPDQAHTRILVIDGDQSHDVTIRMYEAMTNSVLAEAIAAFLFVLVDHGRKVIVVDAAATADE